MRLLDHDINCRGKAQADILTDMAFKVDNMNKIIVGRNDYLDGRFQTVKEDLTSTISSSFDNLMAERFHKYSEISQAFKKFFYEDNIISIIDGKADMTIITGIENSKANKEDLIETNTKI